MNDERLRQILRQGDPAGGDGGLTPDEARAMRRAVLTAVPDKRKRRLLPIFALAGAAATAVLIAVLLLRPEPVGPPAPQPRIATVPAPPAPPAAQPPAGPAPQPPRKGEARRPVHRKHHHSRATAPATPEVQDALASLETAETERQVQITAPGGTRILWILKSGKASR